MSSLTSDLNLAGYREVEHTADWQLHVWAPDLPSLLVQAAYGMYALAGMQPGSGKRTRRSLRLPAQDGEGLLVRFLNELLYFYESKHLVFSQFDLSLLNGELVAKMTGAHCGSISKEIKAVTYHNLEIKKTEQGMEATIVFDV